MRTSYKIRDETSKLTEEGVLEQWWAGVDNWRLRVTSPDYRATITHNGEHLYRTVQSAPSPAALTLLQEQLISPLPSQEEIDHARLFFQSKTFGSVSLECIMVAPSSAKNPPFTLYPTFCFDVGSTKLRATLLNGTRSVARNTFGTFQGKTVPLSISISDTNASGARNLVSSIDQLATYTPAAADFEQSADQKPIPTAPIELSPEIARGLNLTKVAPLYPVEAREKHISGEVRFAATIGVDGHIRWLEPVSSPDELLTDAAVAAVRQWTYKPFLKDGAPVEVRCTITVHFNIG